MDLLAFVRSLSDDELRFIASRDYGEETESHLTELRKLLATEDLVPSADQNWYPYEVIELGSNSLEPGHEREFAACTLLVLHAIEAGYDTGAIPEDKLQYHSPDYDQLPTWLRDAVIDAYTRVGC